MIVYSWIDAGRQAVGCADFAQAAEKNTRQARVNMEKNNEYRDMKSFFSSRTRQDLREEIAVSSRFCDEETGEPVKFVIRGISEAENESIKRACRRPLQTGEREFRFDPKAYCNRLIVAATVYPNFKNAELQRDWGAANAENLLCKMLLAGEYAKLLNAVKNISGFGDGLADLKNAAKN